MSQPRGLWEGLGGPVRLDPVNLDDIDPTLDSCCRREAESNRHANVLRQALERHDVVAEKERRRRHLVQTPLFGGCRCCYDPNSDGGEYRALIELREKRGPRKEPEEPEAHVEEKKEGVSLRENEEDGSDDEFDYLLDEDLPGQSELEERRRAELELAMLRRETALQHGYGVHRQMHPSRVLKAAGLVPGTRDPPPAVVLHLVDPDSMASASLDLYLEMLAEKSARGTKFLRSGGRSTILMDAELAEKVLPRLQPDRDMPALVAIRDGVVVNTVPCMQGLTEGDEIVEDAVYEWLDRCGVLLAEPPLIDAICRIRPEEEALMDYLMTQKPPAAEEELFDCGVPGCNKTFSHEHVGIKNEQQSGLVVPENEVVGDGVD